MELLCRLASWKGILLFIAKMKDRLKIVLCSCFLVVQDGLHAFCSCEKYLWAHTVSLYMYIISIIEPPGFGCCPNLTLMRLE